jgi:hypothetical protein
VCSVPLAVAGWLVVRAVDPSGRIATAAVLAVVGAAGAAAYLFTMRHWRTGRGANRLVGA